ncbi:caspase domain-containing protein [Streptomyces sp. NPDC053367]|uniref:caspase domain-containing protein n=1 Tax=Streptomyces sp. NPDC053367 TaxID=3365700 RepID=UPI0037D2CCF6
MGKAAASLPDPSRSMAVLVGVSDYRTLDPLPLVQNNLASMQRMLTDKDSWGLPPENCIIVPNPARPADVIEPIEAAATAAKDALLVYYAGHGFKDFDNGALCLSLQESKPGFGYTAVYYDWLKSPIVRSGAPRKIVILDCCFGAQAFPAMADSGSSVADQAEVEGTFLIAAAGATELAMADDGHGHTGFTGELLRLVETGVEQGPPLLDLITCFNQLVRRLRAKSRPLPQQRTFNSAGNIALARNRAHARKTATSTKKPQGKGLGLVGSDVLDKLEDTAPLARQLKTAPAAAAKRLISLRTHGQAEGLAKAIRYVVDSPSLNAVRVAMHCQSRSGTDISYALFAEMAWGSPSRIPEFLGDMRNLRWGKAAGLLLASLALTPDTTRHVAEESLRRSGMADYVGRITSRGVQEDVPILARLIYSLGMTGRHSDWIRLRHRLPKDVSAERPQAFPLSRPEPPPPLLLPADVGWKNLSPEMAEEFSRVAAAMLGSRVGLPGELGEALRRIALQKPKDEDLATLFTIEPRRLEHRPMQPLVELMRRISASGG